MTGRGEACRYLNQVEFDHLKVKKPAVAEKSHLYIERKNRHNSFVT